MLKHQRVTLTWIDGKQAILLPEGFEVEGDEVLVYRVGKHVSIDPVQRRTLREALATHEPVDEEFPEIDDPLVEPEDIF